MFEQRSIAILSEREIGSRTFGKLERAAIPELLEKHCHAEHRDQTDERDRVALDLLQIAESRDEGRCVRTREHRAESDHTGGDQPPGDHGASPTHQQREHRDHRQDGQDSGRAPATQDDDHQRVDRHLRADEMPEAANRVALSQPERERQAEQSRCEQRQQDVGRPVESLPGNEGDAGETDGEAADHADARVGELIGGPCPGRIGEEIGVCRLESTARDRSPGVFARDGGHRPPS